MAFFCAIWRLHSVGCNYKKTSDKYAENISSKPLVLPYEGWRIRQNRDCAVRCTYLDQIHIEASYRKY